MKGVLAVLFGIVIFALTVPALQAQRYRVVWEDQFTGKISHGKWMTQKDVAYRSAKSDNFQFAPFIRAYVEKDRRLAFIPLVPRRFDENGNQVRADETVPIKKDH